MESHFFVDIHCHPSLKAYARSFAANPGIQSANKKDNSLVWYRDTPSLFNKVKTTLPHLPISFKAMPAAL